MLQAVSPNPTQSATTNEYNSPKTTQSPHDKHLQYPAEPPSTAMTRCKRDAQPDTRPQQRLQGISAHPGANGISSPRNAARTRHRPMPAPGHNSKRELHQAPKTPTMKGPNNSETAAVTESGTPCCTRRTTYNTSRCQRLQPLKLLPSKPFTGNIQKPANPANKPNPQ
ncbi:hypothetical protein VZT92_000972 [Zoarces viviparus]|uniref:Uncharacterized protein n=1 Tax=Zoarces viviparus TaxID=48416 RepID=A0AAW1GF16_ZOAVI